MIGNIDKVYEEIMDTPLRGNTTVRAEIHTQTSPGVWERVVQFENIYSVEEFSEADPISRTLPQHTVKISVIDLDRKAYQSLNETVGRLILTHIWEVHSFDNTKSVSLTGNQTYVEDITHNKGITTVTGKDPYQKVLKNFIYSAPKPRFMSSLELFRTIVKKTDIEYPLCKINGTISSERVGYIPYQDCSKASQILANAIGGVLGYRMQDFKVTFLIDVFDINKSPTRTVSISDVFRGGIAHKVSPKYKHLMVKGHWQPWLHPSQTYREIRGNITQGEISSSSSSDYSELVVTHEPYYEIHLTPHYDSIKLEPGLDRTVIKFPSKTYVEGTFSLMGAKLIYQPENSKTWNTLIYENGKVVESLDNPLIEDGAKWDDNGPVPTYLRCRHTLEMEYRGDPALEPGDYVNFEYAPGKAVRAIVLSNRVNYKGTLSGKLILKVLLTDDELGSVLVKAYINTRVYGDTVEQIEADTYSDPRMCAFAYDKSGKVIARVYEPKNTPLTTGVRTVSLDVSNNPGQTDIVVYGIYGTTSTLVYTKPTVKPDVTRLDVSINILNSTQGQIKWNQNKIIRVTGGK